MPNTTVKVAAAQPEVGSAHLLPQLFGISEEVKKFVANNPGVVSGTVFCFADWDPVGVL